MWCWDYRSSSAIWLREHVRQPEIVWKRRIKNNNMIIYFRVCVFVSVSKKTRKKEKKQLLLFYFKSSSCTAPTSAYRVYIYAPGVFCIIITRDASFTITCLHEQLLGWKPSAHGPHAVGERAATLPVVRAGPKPVGISTWRRKGNAAWSHSLKFST